MQSAPPAACPAHGVLCILSYFVWCCAVLSPQALIIEEREQQQAAVQR